MAFHNHIRLSYNIRMMKYQRQRIKVRTLQPMLKIELNLSAVFGCKFHIPHVFFTVKLGEHSSQNVNPTCVLGWSVSSYCLSLIVFIL